MSTQHPTHPAPRTVTRRALSIIGGLLLAAFVTAPASADADLATADPADGATVAGTPAIITLTFTQALTENSLFNLKAADGTILARGALDPASDLALVLVPPPLAAGVYTIEWQSRAQDGHLQKGRITFTVLESSPSPTPPPAAGQSPAPTASPGATQRADEPSAGSATDVAIPIAAGLLLVGVLAFLLLRKGRSA